MKKKIYLSLFALSFSIMMIGCSDKESNTLDKSLVGQVIDIRLPIQPNDSWMRSTATDETTINDAVIIVYSADSEGSDLPKIANNIALDSIHQAEEIGMVVINAFSPEENIVDGDIVHIIINYKNNVDLDAVTKDNLITTFALKNETGFTNLIGGLPMYGFGVWNVAEPPVIAMKYSIAKIQLKLNCMGGTHLVGDKYGTHTVENTTYQLYQISDVGNIDGSAHATTNSEPTAEINNNDISKLSAAMSDDYTGVSYIYAYPYATKTIGSTPIALDEKQANISRFTMIMKNDTHKSNYLYYRLDMYDKSTGKYIDIENNHHYSIRVDSINGEGYKSAVEALRNPPANLTYDIIVEEDGKTTPVNSPYTLDVREGKSEFVVSEEPTVIKLAKVMRVLANSTPATTTTPFSVTIDKAFSLNGDISIEINEAPTTLNHEEKIISITASGSGVTMFRYKFTLGSVNYVSPPIKLISNNDMVIIEGFDDTKGVINGYSENKKFDINVTKGYKLRGETTFSVEWDASMTHSVPTEAPTLFLSSWWNNASLEEVLSDGTNLDGVYLNVYRTGPGDPDIEGTVTIITTAPDQGELSHTMRVKITTNCKLPGKAENYSVVVGDLTWADRNYGAALPSAETGLKYELSRNWTNDADNKKFPDHFDYMPIFKTARAGTYLKWPEVAGKCESFSLGGGGWRTPTAFGSTHSGEMHDVRKQLCHSKARVYIVSTNTTTDADDKYIGCYFPLAGFDGFHRGMNGYYWSSTPNATSACFLFLAPENSENLLYSNQENGYSLRCIK